MRAVKTTAIDGNSGVDVGVGDVDAAVEEVMVKVVVTVAPVVKSSPTNVYCPAA